MKHIFSSGLVMLILLGSLFFGFTSKARQDAIARRSPGLFGVFGAIFFLCILVLVLMWTGMIHRGEASPLPWEAYQKDALRHGVYSGVGSFIIILIYNLWTFWIPGHLFANEEEKKHGSRPLYPYIINGLMGLLLSTENNAVGNLLGKFFQQDHS